MLTPIHARILVRPNNSDSVSPAGLHIPSDAGTVRSGIVIAAGPGEPLPGGGFRPMQVQVGDAVLYGKFSGSEVNVANEPRALVLMREDDVYAVVRPDPA